MHDKQKYASCSEMLSRCHRTGCGAVQLNIMLAIQEPLGMRFPTLVSTDTPSTFAKITEFCFSFAPDIWDDPKVQFRDSVVCPDLSAGIFSKFNAQVAQLSPSYHAPMPSTVIEQKVEKVRNIGSTLQNQFCSPCGEVPHGAVACHRAVAIDNAGTLERTRSDGVSVFTH